MGTLFVQLKNAISKLGNSIVYMLEKIDIQLYGGKREEITIEKTEA